MVPGILPHCNAMHLLPKTGYVLHWRIAYTAAVIVKFVSGIYQVFIIYWYPAPCYSAHIRNAAQTSAPHERHKSMITAIVAIVIAYKFQAIVLGIICAAIVKALFID